VGKTVREITEANLKGAYAGESQANMRYTIYAKRQGKKGTQMLPDFSRQWPLPNKFTPLTTIET